MKRREAGDSGEFFEVHVAVEIVLDVQQDSEEPLLVGLLRCFDHRSGLV
ncbi:MAG TPA: hypothetical protein VGY58_14880 [Gemmataceae bacterium]|nr:hypothetical protein [Gemmataceae bacterium]